METSQNMIRKRNENKRPQQEAMRQPNFELLRILCMLMVVSLHYLSKGGHLLSFQETFNANTWIAYGLESFSVVAVNAFVLVTGYFMVNSEFKIKKVIRLIGQILFYTLGISCILLLLGMVPEYGFYQFVNDILPVQMEHYWFMTAYILLLLFTPLLNRALQNMPEKNLRDLLIGLLVFFSLPKTIIPISITIDRKGYDVVWFLIVYLIGAYIRLYGIRIFKNKKCASMLYLGFVILILIRTCCYGMIYKVTGRLEDQVLEAFQYNHLLNLFAAVSFFYIFYHVRIQNKRFQKVILTVSPYVLGVYLLHEQLQVRYLWTRWLGVERFAESPFFILHFIGTIALLFLAGISIEWLRQRIYHVAARILFSILFYKSQR